MTDWRALMERPAWMADANCAGVDPELFFPSRGDTPTLRAAKQVCRACDVQAECLAYALNNGEHFGVWGGLSEKQRRAVRRSRANNDRGPVPAIVRPPIDHGTTAGYAAHRNRGEEACASCKWAHAQDQHYTRPSRARSAAS